MAKRARKHGGKKGASKKALKALRRGAKHPGRKGLRGKHRGGRKHSRKSHRY